MKNSEYKNSTQQKEALEYLIDTTISMCELANSTSLFQSRDILIDTIEKLSLVTEPENSDE